MSPRKKEAFSSLPCAQHTVQRTKAGQRPPSGTALFAGLASRSVFLGPQVPGPAARLLVLCFLRDSSPKLTFSQEFCGDFRKTPSRRPTCPPGLGRAGFQPWQSAGLLVRPHGQRPGFEPRCVSLSSSPNFSDSRSPHQKDGDRVSAHLRGLLGH